MSVAREPLADEGRRVVGSRGFVCAASFALGRDPGNRPVLKPQWPPPPPRGRTLPGVAPFNFIK